jgi:chemotaxis protein MotB
VRSPYLLTGLVLITLFLPGCYTTHKTIEEQPLISDLEASINNNAALMRELQDKIGTLEDSKKILLKQIEYDMVITVPDGILFSPGATILSKRGITVLKTIGEVLENYPDRSVCIEGHTDHVSIAPGIREKDPVNRELSVARSIQIMNYMAGHFQIKQSLISVKGYGTHKPIASNDTAEGRAENRRVVIAVDSNNN